MEAEDLVAVGLVGKPHGLRGEVYVLADPDFPDPLVVGRAYFTDRHGQLVVSNVREQGGKTVIRVEGVSDREGAEALRGERLQLPRAQIELDEDGVWVADLIGQEVRTVDGDLVGVLESVADGPAHDYFVVARPDGGELMIPVVEEMVELSDDGIVVRPIPGLLD